MINTEEFLIGEKEALNQWKGLLVRQCSGHMYTMYLPFVFIVLTKNNRCIKESSLLSLTFWYSSCLNIQDYGMET